MQEALSQSPFARQVLPNPHGVQPVPQSVSLSLPFLAPSSQRGAWQLLPVQTALAQSVASVQPRPVAQPGQPPPQSTPVSVPFCVKSAHVAVAQFFCVHTPLRQSSPLAHG
jgi:hypothetical protein